MSAGDLARLVALAAVWGFSFVFIRVAVPPLGPVALTVIRTLGAGCALLLVAYALGVTLGGAGGGRVSSPSASSTRRSRSC